MSLPGRTESAGPSQVSLTWPDSSKLALWTPKSSAAAAIAHHFTPRRCTSGPGSRERSAFATRHGHCLKESGMDRGVAFHKERPILLAFAAPAVATNGMRIIEPITPAFHTHPQQLPTQPTAPRIRSVMPTVIAVAMTAPAIPAIIRLGVLRTAQVIARFDNVSIVPQSEPTIRPTNPPRNARSTPWSQAPSPAP